MTTIMDRCKTEGVVDVFQVVKALRVQKPGAVPTVVSLIVLAIVQSLLVIILSFMLFDVTMIIILISV